MKPWEETWTAVTCCDALECCTVYLEEDETDIGRFSGIDDKEHHEARAKLAAAAPEMARLLLGLEWVNATDSEFGECLSCGSHEVEGHRPDCALVAVLRKAGVRE